VLRQQRNCGATSTEELRCYVNRGKVTSLGHSARSPVYFIADSQLFCYVSDDYRFAVDKIEGKSLSRQGISCHGDSLSRYIDKVSLLCHNMLANTFLEIALCGYYLIP
jgi:hypothetical protein